MARSIWISAAHIPGKLNVQADLQSWKINLGAEWIAQPHLPPGCTGTPKIYPHN
jgi:hypothetical protein